MDLIRLGHAKNRRWRYCGPRIKYNVPLLLLYMHLGILSASQPAVDLIHNFKCWAQARRISSVFFLALDLYSLEWTTRFGFNLHRLPMNLYARNLIYFTIIPVQIQLFQKHNLSVTKLFLFSNSNPPRPDNGSSLVCCCCLGHRRKSLGE